MKKVCDGGPCLITMANVNTIEEKNKIIGAAIIKSFHGSTDNVFVFCIVVLIRLMVKSLRQGCQVWV